MSNVTKRDMLIIRDRGINYQWFCVPCCEGSMSESHENVKKVIYNLMSHLNEDKHKYYERRWKEDRLERNLKQFCIKLTGHSGSHDLRDNVDYTPLNACAYDWRDS